MAKVSVIVPAFNAEEYLRDTLNSLVAQSMPDWEAIVVDDGSTDSTLAIAREYERRDSRFRAISVANAGQAAARNRGLELATGSWVASIDADDCFHSRALELMLAGAEKSGADIFAARYFCAESCTWKPVEAAPAQVVSGEVALEMMLYQKGITSSVCDKLIRRSLLGSAPFSEGLYYEDLELLGRLLPAAARVAVSRRPLYFYRQHPASFVHRFSERRLHVLAVVDAIEYRCRGNAALLRAARDRRFAANCNMLALATAAGHPRARECWKAVKSLRKEVLLNPKSRLKNRAGALVACLGRHVLLFAAKFVYK